MGKKKKEMAEETPEINENDIPEAPETELKVVPEPVALPEETFFVEDDAPMGNEFTLIETKVKVGDKMLAISNTVDLGENTGGPEDVETEVKRMVEVYGPEEVLNGFQKAATVKVQGLQRKAAKKGDKEFAARIGAEWNTIVPKRAARTVKKIDKDAIMRENLIEKGFSEDQINDFLASKG